MRDDAVRQLLRVQGPLLGLIAVMFGIFLLQELRGIEWYVSFVAIPARITESWQNLRSGMAGVQDFKALGTLLSYAFLHASADHIVYNMLFLWIFAALVVELLGTRWMFGIFLFTAICGGILHVVLNARDFSPMLGASGAVMGFQGAYLGLATRWHLPQPHIWPMSRPVPAGQLALIGAGGRDLRLCLADEPCSGEYRVRCAHRWLCRGAGSGRFGGAEAAGRISSLRHSF